LSIDIYSGGKRVQKKKRPSLLASEKAQSRHAHALAVVVADHGLTDSAVAARSGGGVVGAALLRGGKGSGRGSGRGSRAWVVLRHAPAFMVVIADHGFALLQKDIATAEQVGSGVALARRVAQSPRPACGKISPCAASSSVAENL